jgi:hypothetical protein
MKVSLRTVYRYIQDNVGGVTATGAASLPDTIAVGLCGRSIARSLEILAWQGLIVVHNEQATVARLVDPDALNDTPIAVTEESETHRRRRISSYRSRADLLAAMAILQAEEAGRRRKEQALLERIRWLEDELDVAKRRVTGHPRVIGRLLSLLTVQHYHHLHALGSLAAELADLQLELGQARNVASLTAQVREPSPVVAKTDGDEFERLRAENRRLSQRCERLESDLLESRRAQLAFERALTATQDALISAEDALERIRAGRSVQNYRLQSCGHAVTVMWWSDAEHQPEDPQRLCVPFNIGVIASGKPSSSGSMSTPSPRRRGRKRKR